MNKTRLEAFSDGVLAIIITIMVLEIKVPLTTSWSSLEKLIPVFISYIMSFMYVGIYWGNHHHLLHSLKRVTSGIIWANFNLLFWLSLIPFASGWMGENKFEQNTVILYGILLLICGLAFTILQKAVEKNSHDVVALKTAFQFLHKKAIISVIAYSLAIGLALVNTLVSECIFFAVAIMWIVPDKHLEKALNAES